MTVKCDFHVHSKYSARPTNYVTKKFGALSKIDRLMLPSENGWISMNFRRKV
jgi:hypothetical protein